jgi:hypothetical protein
MRSPAGLKDALDEAVRPTRRSSWTGQRGAADRSTTRCDEPRRCSRGCKRAASARSSCAGLEGGRHPTPTPSGGDHATLAWGPLSASASRGSRPRTCPGGAPVRHVLIGASVEAQRHEAGPLLRLLDGGDPGAPIADRGRLPRAARAARPSRRAVRLPDARRAPADGTARHDLGPGREGRGLGRRARRPGAGAAQQGAGRLPDPLRLRPWRQRLRGHRLPDRAVPRHRIWRPGDPATASTCAMASRRATRGVRALQVRSRRAPAASSSRRSRASTTRCSRTSRSTTTRARCTSGELLESRGEYNVFHDFYRAGAGALRRRGVAQRLLRQHRRGDRGAAAEDVVAAATAAALASQTLETAAFTLFLYARMIGSAAEIDDHLNRGRNMDTRTPASICRFVASRSSIPDGGGRRTP